MTVYPWPKLGLYFSYSQLTLLLSRPNGSPYLWVMLMVQREFKIIGALLDGTCPPLLSALSSTLRPLIAGLPLGVINLVVVTLNKDINLNSKWLTLCPCNFEYLKLKHDINLDSQRILKCWKIPVSYCYCGARGPTPRLVERKIWFRGSLATCLCFSLNLSAVG